MVGSAGAVIGIGTDVVDVERFRASLARTPGLRTRVFTEAEQAYAEARADPTERYAVRFAAKEAVLKALGAGLGVVALADVEVVRDDDSGRPGIVLHGSALDRARVLGVERVHVSLSHSALVAQAFVVAVGSERIA